METIIAQTPSVGTPDQVTAWVMSLPWWVQLLGLAGTTFVGYSIGPVLGYLKERMTSNDARAAGDRAELLKIGEARLADWKARDEERKQEIAENKAKLIQMQAAHHECEKNHNELKGRVSALEDSFIEVQQKVDDCEKERSALAERLREREG